MFFYWFGLVSLLVGCWMFIICQAYRCLKATIAVCWCLASTWPTTIQGHTTIRPPDVSPLSWRFARQVSGHWTNAYHLGGLEFLKKSSKHLESNQKFMESSSTVTGWSCCLDRLRRLWQRRWGGHWKRFFFVGWKVEGKLCWKSVLLFFSNTLCLQVESHSPNAHFVDESFDVRAISHRYASSTRELNLDIQASEKTEVFLYRWKTDVASHDATTLVAWWIQGESALTSLVCSLA